jgi:hypothetical protein
VDDLVELVERVEDVVVRVARDLEIAAGRRPPPPGPSAGADATVDWLFRHRPRAAPWLRPTRRWRAER